eukprot:CAMPEP_0117752784 /NCGR_PEP_ID=MMETSP0947-20121206/11826_1 /TAXON_ID=44440 /ORGANISM="Chattonella subsalsa, Strain CCMP2191" /LENGTH=337 /DNA_ID=CAMNT_0005571521 /DNA_START=160 /DNA_END=1173 /DNA_ORIENTATION=+
MTIGLNEALDSTNTAKDLLEKLVVLDAKSPLLETDLMVAIQHKKELKDLFSSGTLLSSMEEAGLSPESFAYSVLSKEIEPNRDLSWEESVLKWRRKALAVEKYRVVDPAYVASVYTWMTNFCIEKGEWTVAYDALQYAGIPPVGPFFVKTVESSSGNPVVAINLDKIGSYITEMILDMDLEAWAKRSSLGEGAYVTRLNKDTGVGVEEWNFAQNDQAYSYSTALRIQDMVLAVMRVSVRKVLAEIKDGTMFQENSDVILLSHNFRGHKEYREFCPAQQVVSGILRSDFKIQPDGSGVNLADEANAELGIEDGQAICISWDSIKSAVANAEPLFAKRN